MKLKYTFETVELGEEVIAVPVGQGASKIKGVLKLNREAKEIFEHLKSDTNEEQIVDALVLKYENSRDVLLKYVQNMIETLRTHGLIEE